MNRTNNQCNIISTMAKILEFSKFLKHDIVVCLYAKLGVQSQLYIVCYSSTLPLSLSLLYLFNIHSNKVGYNINIQPLINMAMFGYL